MLSLLIMAAALAGAAAEPAEPEVSVQVRLEPPEIPFHRQARLTIEVVAPEGTPVEIADMTERLGDLDVYGEPKHSETTTRRGDRRLTVEYLVEAIHPGQYPIDPVVVTWDAEETGPEGASLAKRTIETAVPGLRVRELTTEEAAEVMHFEANAPLFELPGGWWRSWYGYTAAAVLGVAAAIALAALFRRRLGAPLRPPQTPWDAAYERLKRLETHGWLERGEFEPYYVELSSILRDYVEKRFRLHAPEQTTPEFLAEAGASGLFSPAQQSVLGSFLRHSDLVKFARYEPTRHEMEQSYRDVLRFVDETVPRPVTEAPEEKAA